MPKKETRLFKIKRPENLTLGNIIPNLATLTSAACGMTAIAQATQGYFSRALALIIFAAIMDGMDGRLARMFKTNSQFGVELDSLCDALSFGVAPALIAFFYTTHHIRGIGWILSVIFAIAMILRLARFNVMAADKKVPEYWQYFFTGVPAPAGGLMILWPIALLNATGNEIFADPRLVCAIVGTIALMLVSRIPTINLKKIHIPKSAASLVMLLIIVTLLLMAFYFWKVAAVLGAIYLLTIPYTIIKFIRMKRAYARRD
ncbi:MAG: CDP-diacylglycerol--serine O-phosphatidyltransferase [Rickettsiales bacterium]|nr:CDP-diacylglycerol--serine O-phosphatidyltransferase [Rickettsiales bacterium]